MSFREIVADVREIFPGNAEAIGHVVVAGCDDDFAAAILAPSAGVVWRRDYEGAFFTLDLLNAFVEARFDSIVLDGAAVIDEGFGAGGRGGGGHWQIADFHALGRGEKRHVGRIVKQRVAEAAFVDYERAHASALGLDRAGQAGGACADADHVIGRVHRRTATIAIVIVAIVIKPT